MEDAPIAPDEEGECDSASLENALANIRQLLPLDTKEGAVFLTQLEEAARSYVLFKTIVPLYGTPKEQKRAIVQLVETLDKALAIIDGIAREYQVTIDGMIDWEKPDRFELPNSRTRIWKVRDAAATFLRRYEPRRGAAPNLPLEEAIRTLLPLVEMMTGRMATTSQNKNKPGGPSLKSPEAQAVGILLQSVDPKLTTAKIVNMIEKVRRQPEETESHLGAIMRADLLSALDESLLPDRNDPEQKAAVRAL